MKTIIVHTDSPDVWKLADEEATILGYTRILDKSDRVMETEDDISICTSLYKKGEHVLRVEIHSECMRKHHIRVKFRHEK